MNFTVNSIINNLQKLLKYFIGTAAFVFVTFTFALSSSVTSLRFNLYLR